LSFILPEANQLVDFGNYYDLVKIAMRGPKPDAVVALRAFNRFHTRFFGILSGSFMGSGLSLVEARILYEIAMRQPALASDIQSELGLDRGYLSRIMARFEQYDWITRGRGADARQRPISLTTTGKAMFEAVDGETRQHVERSIAHLGDAERTILIDSLETVSALLGELQTLS
jgi:DNA-binding MarR family transcriptional regulator